MSDYTITMREQTTFWLSKDANGDEVEEEMQRNLYIVPPAGTYRLRFLRFAKPFEMPKSAEYGGGMQTMTRLELRICGGKGDGKKVAPMVGWAFGKGANFGKIIRACERRDIRPGEEFDLFDLAGKEFSVYLQPSEDIDEQTKKPKYVKLVADTIKPVGDAAEDDAVWDDESAA